MTDLVDRLARAESLVQLGRYAQALETLQSIDVAAEVPDALGLRAQALIGLEDFLGALAAAGALVAAAPDEEWGHRLRAIAFSGLGDHRHSVEAAMEAVRLAPDRAVTHQQLALSAVNVRRRRRDARAAAIRAVALDPDEPDSHFALGLAEQVLGRRNAARVSYQRVLAIAPDHSAALNNLAQLDNSLLTPGTAARGYAAALRHDPTATYAEENLKSVAVGLAGVCYLAALLTYLICMAIAAAGPGIQAHVFSPGRAAVGGLMVVAVAAYAWHARRQLPAGVREYVRVTLLSPGAELSMTLLTVAALALAGTVAFVPAGPDWFGWLLRPLLFGIPALIVVAFVTRFTGRRVR